MAGVLSAGMVTRWVLPALAPGLGAPPPRTLPFNLVRAGLAMRRAAWIAWVLLAAALAVIVARHDRIWDDDLGHLSPLPESARVLHERLSADLRAPNVGYLLIATAASREAVLEKSERLGPDRQNWVGEGEAREFSGLGALAIAVLLGFGLRGVLKALRVMLPVYAAIAMTVACFALLGIGLSLFHLVSLLLVLGIGLNYALFFNQAEPGTDSEQGTSLALSVCFLTTFAAFGCLATSRIPVLSAIGLTVTLGCALSLLNAMILGGAAVRSRASR